MSLFPGDEIKTNYGTGPYIIDSVKYWNDGISFSLRCSDLHGNTGYSLTGYREINGRFLCAWKNDLMTYKEVLKTPDELLDTDEIFVIQRKEQTELF